MIIDKREKYEPKDTPTLTIENSLLSELLGKMNGIINYID